MHLCAFMADSIILVKFTITFNFYNTIACIYHKTIIFAFQVNFLSKFHFNIVAVISRFAAEPKSPKSGL